ncbi:MAG: hypothetical protein AB7E09_02795 [Candidatus Izemoplasmatales bacterium]
MKKVILLTLSLVLAFTMMACPAVINTAPGFKRIVMIDGEEEMINLRSLNTDTYEKDKAAFETVEANKLEANPEYEVKEFNPLEYYDEYYILYAHPEGEDLIPEDVVTYLLEETDMLAVDYLQDYVEVGLDRNYLDLSDTVILTSFYEIWIDGDDANFDGVVNEEDEQYYGQFMTDEDGNYVYNSGLSRMRRKNVGDITEVAFYVEDNEGKSTSIRGLIVIVENNEEN